MTISNICARRDFHKGSASQFSSYFSKFAVVLFVISVPARAQVQDSTTKFEYDSQGNVSKITDPLNHSTTLTYDTLSRRIRMTDATANGITRYAFDGIDQLVQVIDARDLVTTYTIDGLGNVLQASSPDTGLGVSTFDDAGKLTSRTDAKQQRTTYRYDELGRLILITYTNGSTVTYLYDQGVNSIGRLSRLTDASGTIDYTYDLHGRVIAETRNMGGATFVTSYYFDSAGRLSGMGYPSGRIVNYGRDALGRIRQLHSTASGLTTELISNVTYLPFGPVKSITLGNGRVQMRAYDIDGRLTKFSLAAQTMNVNYDAANRIVGIVDAANSANGNTYGYDNLDRLANVVTPTSAISYSYDQVGNRTQKVNNGPFTNYTYAPTSNRIIQIGSQAVTTDPNGSITDKGSATFSYDARGRMVSANTQIGLVQYTINSLGQRVRKVTPTATTIFHYDRTGKLIAEATTAFGATTLQEYVYLDELPVAVMK